MTRPNFKIHWFESLPSTNTELKTACADGRAGPGDVYCARLQTSGRGRANRTWDSAQGSGLTFSFAESSTGDLTRDFSITMAAALTVRELLADSGVDAQVKWPNDVLCGPRKICGILAERVAGPHGAVLIVGVGLNVNLEASEAMLLDRPATSMYLETGRRHELEAVLDQLLRLLPSRLDAWRSAGFDALKTEWTAQCALMDEWVTLREKNQTQHGQLRGFGPHGEALLETAPGKISPVWSGDLAPKET